MWNLSALAAKAQEAAARIERQLDDSVGLKADGTPTATTTTTDREDEDDDFFSDGAAMATTRPSATTATGGSDFDEGVVDFGNDDDDEDRDRGDDENDDEDGVVGDGWDDADEIPLDDDDDDNVKDVKEEEGEGDVGDDAREGGGGPTTVVATTTEAPAADEHPDDFDDDYDGDASSPAFFRPGGEGDVVDVDGARARDDGEEEGGRSEADDVSPAPLPSPPPPVAAAADDDDIIVVPASDAVTSPPPPPPPPTTDDAGGGLVADLESRLRQREGQLASKSEQIASLIAEHEIELTKLRQVASETKEEARRRVTRAKERVEEMQARLEEATRRADSGRGQSDSVVAELRAEGEKLARKQGEMEQLVRKARGEARDLEEKLEAENAAREKETTRAEALEKEVKSLREGLSSARKGESQSKKLEGELLAAKEESEKQRASNMVLEQQLKELRDENKSLRKEVQEARAGAALELEGESNKLRRERDDMLNDLEGKLRTSEREANMREDALRHEVSELRKRWQDAVRRAEDLSMDVQHSTAPLMRQLESTERQNRARAAAWAEVETKLRSDLEDSIIQIEKLTKERNDLVSSEMRSQRLLKEKEGEVASSRETIDELSATIETLETRAEELDEEGKRIQQELIVAERKASEGASKVRSEMMQTVVESEERYRSQIDALEEELDEERHRRGNLEKQLDDLVESVTAAEFAQNHAMGEGGQRSTDKEKKLLSATDQASILQDTLAGFDSDVDDDEGHENGSHQVQGQGGSFAAMEQLSLGLKGAKVELDALRKQLVTSEETRASLSEELGEARLAVEKLPLFEQKVSELTMEVKLKEMEIQGLQDDIADVRFLYRSQLDTLLEEKATTPSPLMPSEHDKAQNVRSIVFDDDSN